jgi:predicted HTH domain antitoxin
MPVTISNDLLREAGLSEREARIEFACRLFARGKLALWSAAQWAGLDRTQFEAELLVRKIPIYRLETSDLADDLRTFQVDVEGERR